jgi:hypothetical protein
MRVLLAALNSAKGGVEGHAWWVQQGLARPSGMRSGTGCG